MTAKPRIALVTGWTNPERHSIVQIAQNILSTLEPFSSSLVWLVTNLASEVKFSAKTNLIKINSRYIARDAAISKLIPYIMLYQFKVSWHVMKLIPKTDIFIFAQGSDLSFMPLLLVKLARKKVLLRSDGRPSFLVKKYFRSPAKMKVLLLHLIETLSYSVADRIIPETQHLVDLYEMQKYSAKINIGSQYVDIGTFRETKKLSERAYDVAYIGRLIREKGALQFAESLPLIQKKTQVRFLIIGSGHLQNVITNIIVRNNLKNRVVSLDWVDNKMLPFYLNDIKLVVVPSDYEGLSNSVLEAMACGTLVLATPVGGTPDIIREGETGFILRNNSAECISQNVIRVLNRQDLNRIRKNARRLIENEYSYQAAVERYRSIFNGLS